MGGYPVSLVTKYGKEHHYIRYVHYMPNRKRLGKRKYCYLRN